MMTSVPDRRHGAVRISYVTVATCDFLPNVCVLARSLQRHEPATDLTCYLVGSSLAPGGQAALPFRVVSADALPVPDARRFFFQYTAKELCCALKPHALADALRREDTGAAVYLDADIQVFGSLDEVFRERLAAASVLVTPHLLSPEFPAHILTIMRAGIYNGGVVAVRNDGDGSAFLDWWSLCVATHCIRDPCGGVSADQRWLDMAVGLFPFVSQIRDPGVNVGYWNQHERLLSGSGDLILVNGRHPLRAYHFSNVTPGGLSEFAQRTLNGEYGALAAKLHADYQESLVASACHCPAERRYAWNSFTDGTPILEEHREVVRRGLVDVHDPFAEKSAVLAATPGDPAEAFHQRATYWVTSGPQLLAEARAEIHDLRRRTLHGRLFNLWRRWTGSEGPRRGRQGSRR